MRYFKGFTLVELLVAITIVAILGTIGVAAFNSVFKNNRDQQRWRDLGTIKQALELYRAEQGYYPAAADFSLSCSTSYLYKGTRVYLAQDETVKDPDCNSRTYVYQSLPTTCSGTNCFSFILCAKKEGSTSFDLPTECQSLGLECGAGPNDCNMGVSSD